MKFSYQSPNYSFAIITAPTLQRAEEFVAFDLLEFLKPHQEILGCVHSNCDDGMLYEIRRKDGSVKKWAMLRLINRDHTGTEFRVYAGSVA